MNKDTTGDARALGGAPGSTVDQPPVDSETTSPACAVVGMGASAGGLEAFEQFFRQMPADCGMAFVLVPHLDPGHRRLV